MRIFAWLSSLALLLYLGALGWIYFAQRQLLFHPTHERQAREGFYLRTPGGKVRVEVRNPGKEQALIYLPGNSEHWWEDLVLNC